MKHCINLKDDAKIRAALSRVNGRSTSFCITDACDVRALAARATTMLLDRGVLKRDLPGTILTVCPAGPARGTVYTANSTLITLRRGGTHWFLTSVKRCSVSPTERELFSLCVSPAAGASIVARAMRSIEVQGQFVENNRAFLIEQLVVKELMDAVKIKTGLLSG